MAIDAKQNLMMLNHTVTMKDNMKSMVLFIEMETLMFVISLISDIMLCWQLLHNGIKSSQFMLNYEKKAYSNILKILPPKNENFQIKILIFFKFLLKNIDCGYSLEPPRLAEAVLTSTHNLCFEQK